MSIFSFFKKAVTPTTITVADLLGMRGSLDKFSQDTTQDLLLTPSTNSIIYACVTTIMNAFQEAPMIVQNKNADGQWETVQGSPLLEPWQMNPDMSEGEIQQYQVAHIELTGMSYVWLWRDALGFIRKVWPIPTAWVVPNYTKKQGTMGVDNSEHYLITSYTIQIQAVSGVGGTYMVTAADMLVTKFINPTDLTTGLAPLSSAAKYAAIDARVDGYAYNAVNNLNIPSVVASSEKLMGEQQKQDLNDTLRAKLGRATSKSTIILEGSGMKLSTLNPLEEFDFNGLNATIESRLCMVFHVPPVIIGSRFGVENSPWSNIENAQRWFYRHTMSALWAMFTSSLTRTIVPSEDWDMVRVTYDLTNIKELQADVDKNIETNLRLFEAGTISQNELRNRVGFDTIDGGDVFKVKINEMFVQALNTPMVLLTNTPEEHMTDNAEV